MLMNRPGLQHLKHVFAVEEGKRGAVDMTLARVAGEMNRSGLGGNIERFHVTKGRRNFMNRMWIRRRNWTDNTAYLVSLEKKARSQIQEDKQKKKHHVRPVYPLPDWKKDKITEPEK
eukprot:TRINITY_DN3574_c0_g1_i1.p1 TRINITY_DN3574_c0_g1~~TRINITY_DN3574_c0_g1_i1.p1  ORF type:complete len:117 (-),score=31.05 TRINITY_DN3574_c0_g1_i1:73-423(-)